MALRVLLVGYGWWGKVLEKAILEDLSSEIDLVGVVSPHDLAPPLSGVELYADYEHALAKSGAEAVFLATPHRLHVSQIELAAAAGIHVFCEKPLALTREAAARAVAVCQEAGVVLGIGFQRRCWPSFVALQERIRAGDLGDIGLMEGNYSNNTDVAAVSGIWRADERETPGAVGLTGMSIHPLDQMVSLAGELAGATAVVAEASSVSLKFNSGVVGNLSWMQGTPEYYRLAVFGSSGWAELCGPTEGRWKDAQGVERQLVSTADREDPLAENLRHFAGAVSKGGEWQVAAEELIATVSALEMVADASRSTGS